MGPQLSHLTDYIAIFFGSTLKFVLGPVYGMLKNSDLSIFETAIFTFLGMMCSVLVVTYLGEEIRTRLSQKFYKKKKMFSKRKRTAVKVWNSWGIRGIAFLTPLILTPIGGAILAVSFGEKKKKIIINMSISGLIWAFTLTTLFYYFRDFAIKIFIH